MIGWIVIAAALWCFFKQKTAYEISTRDWSSDVCSSDLVSLGAASRGADRAARWTGRFVGGDGSRGGAARRDGARARGGAGAASLARWRGAGDAGRGRRGAQGGRRDVGARRPSIADRLARRGADRRSASPVRLLRGARVLVRAGCCGMGRVVERPWLFRHGPVPHPREFPR